MDTPTPKPDPGPRPTPRSRRSRWARRARRAALALLIATGGIAAAACIHLPAHNPTYPATKAEIRAELDRMRAQPTGLERPVLVLSGWRSPPGTAAFIAGRIEALTGAADEQVAVMSYPLASDITPLGDRVVAFVDEHWPSDDPAGTTEVDVVAISMGGLVARWAASDRGEGSRRLRINTLYTLATPHRGAALAEHIRIDAAARQMHAGSDFLQHLDEALARDGYEVVPYAVLRDGWVGATNTAPPGMDPIWVRGRLILSHHLIALDERIAADLALRLRGAPPLASPSTPPRN